MSYGIKWVPNVELTGAPLRYLFDRILLEFVRISITAHHASSFTNPISDVYETWDVPVSTTMIYTHVLNKGGKGVVYPQGVGRGCKGLKPQQHTLSPLDR